MNLIVETDLGRDPDDFFALLYLVSAGVNIRAITISPGDRDQIAVAKFLCKELGLDIPIGAGKIRTPDTTSSGGVHYKILDRYGHSKSAESDASGKIVIHDTMKTFPDCELFAIGPLTSVGQYLREYVNEPIFKRATIQGGFVGYHLYRPKRTIAKFEGLTSCPTFNLNGDVKGAEALLASTATRSFVGKNVCHTVIYNQDSYDMHFAGRTIQNRAMELFKEAMGIYLETHSEKKFHDPTAAVMHLHPEVGIWLDEGNVYRANGGWGTGLGGNDKVLIDVDRDALWSHVFRGT